MLCLLVPATNGLFHGGQTYRGAIRVPQATANNGTEWLVCAIEMEGSCDWECFAASLVCLVVLLLGVIDFLWVMCPPLKFATGWLGQPPRRVPTPIHTHPHLACVPTP